jgi:hydroxymethylbilane synthase
LALWQANWVAAKLEAAGASCELVPMDTSGDRLLDVSIPEIGSKGVFTLELERELQRGHIDLAVHSAKDMPSELPDGFRILAFTHREQAHDVLVAERDLDLNQPITVGTSSTRRLALLKHHYPHIKTVPVRGNLQTRIGKLKSGQMDALMLAYAGVERLGLGGMIKYNFPKDQFVPAVGQGSMAIEINLNLDPGIRQMVRAALNHQETEYCLIAERAFLYRIQGGCSIPAFAYATLDGDKIYMQAGIVSLNGRDIIQFTSSNDMQQASGLGVTLATKVLASGGNEILKDIKQQFNQKNED